LDFADALYQVAEESESDPLFYPMTNTIAYGLAFGTVLPLGVAPVLYAMLFRVDSPAPAIAANPSE
jgi:hypothetical protein